MAAATTISGSPISLSIIIPTYNGWRWLERCLASVERHRPASSEILVVDDASTDGTAERVASEFPRIRVIRLAKNRGFCGAANAGLAEARGAIVELLNNDTEVTANWSDAPLATLADPSIAAVAPLVCQLPFRGRIDSAGDRFWPIGVAKKRGEGRLREEAFHSAEDVDSVCACAAFYRASAIRQVGGFPDHYGAYLDDVDLGLRLRLAGRRLRYVPASRVLHWGSRSHAVRSRRITEQVARNSERLYWTNLTAGQLAVYLAPHLAFMLVQMAYKATKGDFAPWFVGKLSVLAEARSLWRTRQAAQRLRRAAAPVASGVREQVVSSAPSGVTPAAVGALT